MFLLTWREVLHGHDEGIKIWYKSDTFRGMYDIFRNWRRTKEGTNFLLNALNLEVFGDHIPLYHLLTCYYHANALYSNSLMNDLQSVIKTYEPKLLQGNPFNVLLLDKIDGIFKNAIKDSFTQFNSLSQLLFLSTYAINCLLSEYKKKLPKHFEMMKAMFLYDKKET